MNLTEKQRQILKYSSDGLIAKLIAEKMGTTPKIIDYHMLTMRRANDCKTITQLAVKAVREGAI